MHMSARGTMGFLKNQQVKMATRLLAWQYEKSGSPLPEARQLNERARQLVEDAHRIARARGGNVIAILKQMASEAIRR
ncbi:hypothetical protein Dvar_42510 [Desulfosarcina variabilis str. Montpellier]